MHPTLEKIRRGIIVSAQAGGQEPLNTPEMLCAMAESALLGGACGIRMAQVDNLRLFKSNHPHIPLIGITKPESIPLNADELVYITPTFADVASIAPYCDIIALDATQRPRPGEDSLADIIRQTRELFPHCLLMADLATPAEGRQAVALGFDLLSTTLSGYTVESGSRANPKPGRPDFDLLTNLVALASTPVIMEGRIWLPEEVSQAFSLGAWSVVIGSAVTRPHEITRRFVAAI